MQSSTLNVISISINTYFKIILSLSILGLLAGTIGTASAQTTGTGQSFATIYESEFSTDPNWQTLDADNFFWSSSSSAQFARVYSQRGDRPGRYFVTETTLDPTKSFVLEADINILEFSRSSGVTFGLFSDDFRASNQRSFNGARSRGTMNIHLYSLDNLRNNFMMNLVDSNRNNQGGGGNNATFYETDVWYTFRIEYNAEVGSSSFQVIDRDSGDTLLLFEKPDTGITLNPDMRFLGVAMEPQGLSNTSFGDSRTNVDDHSEFLIDNVRLQQITDNAAPEISDLGQFKMLGLDAIGEGDTFVGNTAVFKAEVTDPEGDDVQLEIEIIPTDGSNTSTYPSDTASSGSEIEVEIAELIPKDQHYIAGGNEQSFRWRARVIDSNGVASEWQEFGTAGNTDFTAKVVPLWTQLQSDFPSQDETRLWFNQLYADGRGNNPADPRPCGLDITLCGCGIASAVMLANYYGITESIEGTAVNPLTLNAYLLEHGGYDEFGNIQGWRSVVSNYFGETLDDQSVAWRLTFNDGYSFSRSVLDEQLAQNFPVMNRAVAHGHFNVIDSQVGSTYTVRDPLWYETKTLNGPVKRDEMGDRIAQAYNNVFTKARLVEHHPVAIRANPSLHFTLASPAELLVTDPEGNRVGIDPEADVTFSEIDGASYHCEYDIVSSEDPIDETDYHCTKMLHIPNPVEGAYDVQVIGTDTGEYTLSSLLVSTTGETGQSVATATTQVGQITQYVTNYDTARPTDTDLEVVEAETIELLLAQLRTAAESITKRGVRTATLATIKGIEKAIKKDRTRLAKLKLKLLDLFVRKMTPRHIDQVLSDNMRATIKKIKDLLTQ